MQRSGFLCSAGLALLAGGWSAGRSERVVERRFESRLTLSTNGFRVITDEDGRSTERDIADFTREQHEELELTDTYEDELEPPGKFTRLYRTVTGSLRVSGQGEPREKEESAGLEGARVTFVRRGKTYLRSSDAAQARKAQLNDLRVNLTMERLLPPEDLAPGETWALSFADLNWLLSPAVNLYRRPPRERPETAEDRRSVTPSVLLDPQWLLFLGAEGEATATLEPPAEGEGSLRSATLRFRFDNARAGGLADLLGPEAEVEDEVRLRWQGTGTLEWDADRGSASLELAGELEFEEEFRVTYESAGQSASMRGTLAGSGELALSAGQRPGE